MADSNPATQLKEEPRDEELELTQEDTSAETTQPNAMNLDGAIDATSGTNEVPHPVEARIPAKKDATLREFLGKMDDYAPIVRLTYPMHVALKES